MTVERMEGRRIDRVRLTARPRAEHRADAGADA